LAGERIVGQFRTDEPETFGEAAAAMLGASYVAEADTIRLARAYRP
jgi:hypothetical protein